MRKGLPNPDETLAENLAAIMKRRGLKDRKVSALAKSVGASIGPKTVNNIQNKRHATTLETLSAVAEALRVPAWMLLLPKLNPEIPNDPAVLKLLDDYLACDPETRRAIERIVAGQAQSTTHQQTAA